MKHLTHHHGGIRILVVAVLGLSVISIACDGPAGPQGATGALGAPPETDIERVFIRLDKGPPWASEGASWYVKLDVPSITPAVVDSGFILVESDGMQLPSTRRFFQEHGESLALTYTFSPREVMLWGTWRDSTLSRPPVVEAVIVTTFSPATSGR